MAGADRELIDDIRVGLRRLADPDKAPRMQAYMKSTMPYLGVQSAGVKSVCREIFARHPLASYGTWRATTLALWREASHREERYCAIALTGARPYREHQEPRVMPM